MTLRIMSLNMIELRRLSKGLVIPIQVSHPLMNMWVSTPHIPQIRLEMLDVNHIEPDDGGEESYVDFGDRVAEIVGSAFFVTLGEVRFDAVEGGEEGCDGFFVGGLGGGKAGFVDAVVDVVVDPVVCFVDFGFEG